MDMEQILEQLKAGATDEQLAQQMKSNPSAFGDSRASDCISLVSTGDLSVT